MRSFSFFAGLLFFFPVHTSSCDAICTQNSPEFLHWTCNGCNSKFGCCNKIQFTYQLARAKKDDIIKSLTFDGMSCVETIAALPGIEGAFSFVHYERKVSQSRDSELADHNFVVQQYRDGQWNSTLIPQFPIQPVHPHQININSSLSESGGMHRRLSITLSMSQQVPYQGRVSIILFLTQDFFVDIEHLIEQPCVGDFDSCTLSIQSNPDEIIDMEEPSFTSPQHAIRLDVSWQNPTISEPTLIFALCIHARYPEPKGGYIVARLPFPVLLGVPIGSSEIMSNQQTHVVYIPAGHGEQHVIVTMVTTLCSVLGSLLILRELSRVSTWN